MTPDHALNDTRDIEPEPLLAMPALDPDAGAALALFRERVRSAGPIGTAGLAGSFGAPLKWAGAVATAVVVAAALGLTGVADSIFQIFEARQFTAVNVAPGDLRTLEQLGAFGSLTWSQQPAPHQVASAAAASAATGLAAPVVTLPSRVGGPAVYGVLDRTTATFTFDAATAAAAAAKTGRTAPPMPASIDGSTLVFTGGPAIVMSYGTGTAGSPSAGVVVVVARTPTVGSDRASIAQIQGYLLAQPGISPELAAQIKGINDPASTLPIPIPVGQATTKRVTVHGVTDGLFVGDSTGLGSGVIWQQSGLVYLVGGTLTEAETLAVANSLR
ncbi:MAG TPA: hypothetical protein VM070_03445 [Candidatus Saccharimonadales bacterium]|nr:hypothetical protein [Candidatus Saccharimonadales bacterium]